MRYFSRELIGGPSGWRSPQIPADSVLPLDTEKEHPAETTGAIILLHGNLLFPGSNLLVWPELMVLFHRFPPQVKPI